MENQTELLKKALEAQVAANHHMVSVLDRNSIIIDLSLSRLLVKAANATGRAMYVPPALTCSAIAVGMASVDCPYCEATLDGFTGDPRGTSCTCDECLQTFEISEDARVTF